ncbi:MAG TPA: glycosyltransferase family 2 protein [Vicinamibacterales bacterium]|nr:glycosyltransferase family 2 protein [Vicinamibacterales bacterium]
MPEPSLAIVIVSYNVRADLERCLRSIVGHTAPFPTAVAVVDNGSTDGTPEMLRRDWPIVHTIEAGGNVGFSRGNNLGIRATASDLVLLLNPDTEVPDGQVPALVRALLAEPAAAAVGPRLVDASGQPELSFGPMVSPWGEFTQRRLMRAYEARQPWAVARVERMTRQPGTRDWVSGACLLARRADLEAVGLLDERYFMYTEDVDLCAAFRARGRQVRFVPGVTVHHLRGRSAAGAPAATDARRRQSQVAFYRKHHPAWAPLLTWWLRRRGLDVR